MKFDYIIGNPPYQEDSRGDSKSYIPVYNQFMDEAFKVGTVTELITPARFLFNAGATPKEWNEKMLNDKHFKVLHFEIKGSNIFPVNDIKGGIAITCRNLKEEYAPIKTFTAYNELNSILAKVMSLIKNGTMDSIVSGRDAYRLSKLAINEHPEIVQLQSKGHKYDVGSGAFKVLKDIIFFEIKPNDNKNYVKFLGLWKNKRVYWWTEEKYHNPPESFYKFKVFIPKANGSGAIGEVLSTPLIGEPLIGEPLIGATDTFLSIGSYETEEEAENCLKYVKTKFARAMLGILKVTQINPRSTWKYVPLQDFSNNSDINWSQSISDIDKQLYKKYGLSEEEINFIETHVKEME